MDDLNKYVEVLPQILNDLGFEGLKTGACDLAVCGFIMEEEVNKIELATQGMHNRLAYPTLDCRTTPALLVLNRNIEGGSDYEKDLRCACVTRRCLPDLCVTIIEQ